MDTRQLKHIAEMVGSKGSVSIGLDTYKNKNYFYEQFRISGDKEMLKTFQTLFGGTVSSNGKKCKCIWRITADKAHKMFVSILPYMKNNKELIEALVEFGNSRKELASMVWNDPKREAKKKEFIKEAEILGNTIKEISLTKEQL